MLDEKRVYCFYCFARLLQNFNLYLILQVASNLDSKCLSFCKISQENNWSACKEFRWHLNKTTIQTFPSQLAYISYSWSTPYPINLYNPCWPQGNHSEGFLKGNSGVRPSLPLYHQTIKSRSIFKSVCSLFFPCGRNHCIMGVSGVHQRCSARICQVFCCASPSVSCTFIFLEHKK